MSKSLFFLNFSNQWEKELDIKSGHCLLYYVVNVFSGKFFKFLILFQQPKTAHEESLAPIFVASEQGLDASA